VVRYTPEQDEAAPRENGETGETLVADRPQGEKPARRKTRGDSEFRTDIQALRAIAVVAVILYHAHISFASGGYIGVDVFFVISGYLITSRLVRDARSGKRSLVEFYARRARRILPVATLVLLVTIVGARLFQNPLALRQTGIDIRSAAWFVSNIRFAHTGTTYLAEAGPVPLVQQYWSLSVEEQFYLLWPVLVLCLAAAAAWTSRSMRVFLGAALAGIVGITFAISVASSKSDPIHAFFLLQSRAWEFGVGALLAVFAANLKPLARQFGELLLPLGLLAIVVPVVAYGSGTTWPGFHAAVPVLGTALVIAAGLDGTRGAINGLLAVGPVQATGRYSYSLYLWHWPLVVLFVAKHSYSSSSVAVALIGTALLSIASFHLVESPAQRSAWLRMRPAVSILLGLALILVVTVASFALNSAKLDSGRPSGAAPHVPGAPPVPIDFVPSDLSPSLDKGTSAFDPNAESNVTCRKLGQCSYGSPNASTRVVLFGDSHAGQWTAALRVLADQNGWRVDRFTRGGCSALAGSAARPGCRSWINATWKTIDQIKPALLILSEETVHLPANRERFRNLRLQAISRAPAGTRVAIMSETPETKSNVPSCLATHLTNTRPCEPKARAKWMLDVNAELATIARQSGATFVDATPMVCTATRCPAIAGNILVYRDYGHLTSTFVASRAPDLGMLLAPILAAPPHRG
jgi:peptidoglycan/LPS O-acetylase OafA/YrhL